MSNNPHSSFLLLTPKQKAKIIGEEKQKNQNQAPLENLVLVCRYILGIIK